MVRPSQVGEVMPIIGKILIFVFANVLLSIALIEVDAFEWFFEYTRAHEDWELDELAMVVVVALLTSTSWATIESIRLNRHLRAAHKTQLRAERELADLRRIQVLSTLSAGIAHTGNNLLQPIMTLSRAGRRQLGPDHAVSAHLEKIEHAAADAAQLFADVLKLGAADEADKLIDAAAFLRKNTSLFRVAVPSGVDLQVHLGLGKANIGMSGAGLVDVVLTLLSNAVDALGGKPGSIAISLDPADTDDRILLTVRDTGRGISEDDLARVFDPFFTRKQSGRGTGLGLSIVKTLVESAGGSVRVESVLGVGTNMTLKLPLVEPNMASTP